MNLRAYLSITMLAGAGVLVGCDKAPPTPVEVTTTVKEQFVADAMTSQSISGFKAIGACALENIVTISDGGTNSDGENRYSVKKGNAYKLIGFATDVEKGAVHGPFKLALVGGQIYVKNGVAGLERPDVAKYFKIPSLGTAGYQVDVGFDNVAVGDYSVVLLSVEGTNPTVCPTHQTISVK